MYTLESPFIVRSNRYRLKKKEAHIWRTDLNLFSRKVAEIDKFLSPEERHRASRFCFEHDKKRFIVGRGLLRILLGNYLDIPPAQIEFVYGEYGKPKLKDSVNHKNIFFNVTHSNELVLYAFSPCPWIGIDIEYVRHINRTIDMAKRFFHLKEYHLLESLPSNKRTEVFYKLWTCKEAYLKATGQGLAGLEDVEIIDRDNKQIIVVHEDAKSIALNNWCLYKIKPENGYCGAIAIKGQDWEIKLREI